MALLLATLAAACSLLGTPVDGDCQAAQRYESSYRQAPAAHRALVTIIVIVDWPLAKATPDGALHLPAAVKQTGLILHEVGHLVSYQQDSALLKAWTARFWRGGHMRGTTESRYSARSPGEDFSESYRATIEDETRQFSGARSAWMRRHVAIGHA